jgi:capsular exopolysaccharide synthesis family protein
VVQQESTGEPGLLDYVRVLWRRRLIVILAVIVAVGATIGIDAVRTRVYRATSNILFVSQNYSSGGTIVPLSPTDIATDIELVQGAAIKATVAKNLGAVPPPVTVNQVGTTEVAQISVSSPDKILATKAANAYVRAYIANSQSRYLANQQSAESQIQQQINGLQTQIQSVQTQINLSGTNQTQIANLDAQLGTLESQQQTLHTQLSQFTVEAAQTPSGGQLVAPATVPTSPVSPKPVADAVIGGVIGLIIGIALAMLREYLDDRIHNKAELEQVATGLPVLGIIPRIDDWRDSEVPFLAFAHRPKSPAAEAYRGLRTSIQFARLDHPIRILHVTSPAAADGKTTTSANLAVAMAEAGQNVVLICCDLRRPRVHEFFSLPNTVGLTSVLAGQVDLPHALVHVPGIPRLTLLPSGPLPANPSEILGSPQTRELFTTLSQAVDLVILDSPPLLPVTDASILATVADGSIVVTAAGETTRRDLSRAIELLHSVDASVTGVVLNNASESDSYVYYGYSGQYGYGGRSGRENGNGDGSDPGTDNGSGSGKSNGKSKSTRSRNKASNGVVLLPGAATLPPKT